jgi:hypothetical protein
MHSLHISTIYTLVFTVFALYSTTIPRVIRTRTLVPYYCICSYFTDLHYCNYILVIKRLNIAKIILDTTYVPPVEPRKLVTTLNKRNRSNKVTGKALE